jgi:GAF domain-containing protein
LIVHRDRGNGLDAERIGEAFGADGSSILGRSAIVIAPLVTDQRVAGLLLAARPNGFPDWTLSDIEFLVAAAGMAAVALQHATMRSVLRGLASTAAELNSPMKPATLLRKLTEAAMLCTQSTMGLSGLREGDLLICRELRRRGSWEAVDLRFEAERGTPGWSWTHRAPCVANEAPTDPRADRSLVELYGVRSALTVPIVDRSGEVLGFFELYNKAAGIPYGDQDVLFAMALAHMTAMALETTPR